MTRFLDLRIADVGGELAAAVAIKQGTSLADLRTMEMAPFLADIQGRHTLIGIHGFNVNRADGIAHLANWERQLQLDPPSVFVGVLWPGDSIWGHGLDYPEEGRVANDAGHLLAPFVDAAFRGCASISLASHSLGARVLLQLTAQMNLPVRRATLMAAAIDDNCLATEFRSAAAKIEKVSVLASHQDEVLSALFPLGNLLAGIIAEGHPWWHAALGRGGPSNPKPANFQAPFEIPDAWNFGHGAYLEISPLPSPVITLPADVPPEGSPLPDGGVPGWQSAWSAAVSSTRFR